MSSIFLKELMEQSNRIENTTYDVLLNDEKSNFTINGVVLEQEVQLVREKIKIQNAFTFGIGEDFDFHKYNCFRKFIDELSYNIENKSDFDTLKKIIVSLDLELQIDVQFVSVFYEMLKRNELNCDYELLKDNYCFDELYCRFYNGYRRLK